MAVTNEELEKRVAALEATVARLRAALGGGSATSSDSGGGDAASDAELRGQWGDPKTTKDPKRWAGASYAGANYSQCPSDYLTCLADFLEWKAGKDAEKPDPPKHRNNTPYYVYDRKNARLARGWARRNEGKTMPPPQRSAAVDDPYAGDEERGYTPGAAADDDEIPF